MFVKISRLINLYIIIIIIIIVIHENAKKKYINIAFHNFKIKCARNKTELRFQIG